MKKQYDGINDFIKTSAQLKKSVALDNPKAPKLSYARVEDYTRLGKEELFVAVVEIGNTMKEQFVSILMCYNKPVFFKTTRVQESIWYYRDEMIRIEQILEKHKIVFDSYPVSKYC